MQQRQTKVNAVLITVFGSMIADFGVRGLNDGVRVRSPGLLMKLAT